VPKVEEVQRVIFRLTEDAAPERGLRPARLEPALSRVPNPDPDKDPYKYRDKTRSSPGTRPTTPLTASCTFTDYGFSLRLVDDPER